MEIASFGKMKFEVSASKLNPINSLQTATSQIADNNSSAETQPITNGRGTDLKEYKFSCNYVLGMGINDILKEYNDWEVLVTKYEYIYLAKKKMTPLVQLRKVDLSNVQIDIRGRITSATISFEFKEYNKSTTSVIGSSAFGTSAQKSVVTQTSPQKAASTPRTVKKGDYVKPTGQRYATGQRIPNWVKERYHQVYQIKADRVLLGHPSGINSWIKMGEFQIK